MSIEEEVIEVEDVAMHIISTTQIKEGNIIMKNKFPKTIKEATRNTKDLVGIIMYLTDLEVMKEAQGIETDRLDLKKEEMQPKARGVTEMPEWRFTEKNGLIVGIEHLALHPSLNLENSRSKIMYGTQRIKKINIINPNTGMLN